MYQVIFTSFFFFPSLSRLHHQIYYKLDKKFVDVDMLFVGLKFKNDEPAFGNDLVLVELVARFHRNYSLGEIPNWTVTLFKVTRFNGTP